VSHYGFYVVHGSKPVGHVCPRGIVPPGVYIRLEGTYAAVWWLKSVESGRRYLVPGVDTRRLRWCRTLEEARQKLEEGEV